MYTQSVTRGTPGVLQFPEVAAATGGIHPPKWPGDCKFLLCSGNQEESTHLYFNHPEDKYALSFV